MSAPGGAVHSIAQHRGDHHGLFLPRFGIGMQVAEAWLRNALRLDSDAILLESEHQILQDVMTLLVVELRICRPRQVHDALVDVGEGHSEFERIVEHVNSSREMDGLKEPK